MATAAEILSVPCPTCKMPADSDCVAPEGEPPMPEGGGIHSSRIYRFEIVTDAIAHNEAVLTEQPEPAPEPEFRFAVIRDEEYGDGPERWRVELPHQCDAWLITGGSYTGEPHEQAVASLEKFIAEAQQALAALREKKEQGRDRY